MSLANVVGLSLYGETLSIEIINGCFILTYPGDLGQRRQGFTSMSELLAKIADVNYSLAIFRPQESAKHIDENCDKIKRTIGFNQMVK